MDAGRAPGVPTETAREIHELDVAFGAASEAFNAVNAAASAIEGKPLPKMIQDEIEVIDAANAEAYIKAGGTIK